MATYILQIIRMPFLVLLGLPIFLAACISSQPYPEAVQLPPPKTTPQIRAPQIGQQWVYQVRNVFNQSIVDVVTEKVVAVGKEVRIARTGQKAGQLPDEIQTPWGYVLEDPHWRPAQIFQKPLPLWPEQLVPGWSNFSQTRYQVPGYPDGSYYWGLSVKALQWERVSVPAGQFTTLKYQNTAPYFQSDDVFRLANYREEDVWIAPEVGRWVIKRGYGRYVTSDVFWANAYWEDYLEWELISWK